MRKLLPDLSDPARKIMAIAALLLVIILGSLNAIVIRDLLERDQARQEAGRKDQMILDSMACSLDIQTESAIGIAEFLEGTRNAAKEPVPPEIQAAIDRLKRNAERASSQPRRCKYPAGSGIPGPPPVGGPDPAAPAR